MFIVYIQIFANLIKKAYHVLSNMIMWCTEFSRHMQHDIFHHIFLDIFNWYIKYLHENFEHNVYNKVCTL